MADEPRSIGAVGWHELPTTREVERLRSIVARAAAEIDGVQGFARVWARSREKPGWEFGSHWDQLIRARAILAETEAVPLAYTCPKCGAVSHNPNDAANRYCGACHVFEGDGSTGP